MYCHVQPRAALELAHTFSHLLVRTISNLLELAQTRSYWLTFSRTLSNSLARCCKLSHSVFIRFLHAILQMKPFAIATKFCENILIGVGDVNCKTKFKGMPLSGWIQLLVPMLIRASLPRPSYLSPCKYQRNRTIRGRVIAI